jgi:hypothetical protein
MKKIPNHEEENKLYKIISDSLIHLCETKPQNQISFLSEKLIEIMENNDTQKKTDSSYKKNVFLLFLYILDKDN